MDLPLYLRQIRKLLKIFENDSMDSPAVLRFPSLCPMESPTVLWLSPL